MLQIVLVFIGVAGLIKRKIKISSKKEIVGTPVIFLSLFYLVAAFIPLNFIIADYAIIGRIGVIAVVTILVIIFAKGQPVVKS